MISGEVLLYFVLPGKMWTIVQLLVLVNVSAHTLVEDGAKTLEDTSGETQRRGTEVDEMFDSIDTDRDGQISRSELRAHLMNGVDEQDVEEHTKKTNSDVAEGEEGEGEKIRVGRKRDEDGTEGSTRLSAISGSSAADHLPETADIRHPEQLSSTSSTALDCSKNSNKNKFKKAQRKTVITQSEGCWKFNTASRKVSVEGMLVKMEQTCCTDGKPQGEDRAFCDTMVCQKRVCEDAVLYTGTTPNSKVKLCKWTGYNSFNSKG